MSDESFARPQRIRALDLFAGTGWGVACRALGIDEHGVEVMPEAVAIRDANGMHTAYRDVWDGLIESDRPRLLTDAERAERAERERVLAKPIEEWDEYDLLIASPPCQTFSMAGAGAGRKALDEVLAAIDARLYLDPEALRAFGDVHDPKTALVLAPLAHVARDVPMFVVFEQVPPVLPVWERCAEEMRKWGYSVWTGNLQAEQYGVPQTRKRAILIARADGKEAKPPTPTHSRYYSRTPQKLDEGVLPWVSMAEALGWGMTERPMVTAGNAIGRAEGIGGSGGKAAIEREKARGAWQSNQNTSTTGERYERDVEEPAPTLTAGSRSARFLVEEPAQTITCSASRYHVEDRRVMRSNFSAPGNGTAEERGRTMRPDSEPSLTMTGKSGHWVAEGSRPAPTVTGGGAATGGAEVFGRRGREIVEKMVRGADASDDVWEKRPATTVAGSDVVAGPGWSDPVKGGVSRQDRPGSTRVTVAEAAALQSYPADFVWDADVTKERFVRVYDRKRDPADPDDEGEWHMESRGVETKPITKTNKFLQVGNAVPCKLAEAILREVLS